MLKKNYTTLIEYIDDYIGYIYIDYFILYLL